MRVMTGAAIALGAMGIAGSLRAQEIVNPTWASIPDGEAMAEAYPEFASMIALDGDVNLRCMVAPDGTLSLCRVNVAVPDGVGFEDAALALASSFRVNPREVDGEVRKSRVQFTIRFRMEPEDAPPPAWTGAEPSPGQVANALAVLKDMLGPTEPAEELARLELDVDPEREARVRAILLQAEAEFRAADQQAAALALARLVTPEQLAEIKAGGAWPQRPTEDQLKSAGDTVHLVSKRRDERLRELYCAEFPCPARTPAPAI